MNGKELALRIRNPLRRDPRGQALIEFALVLPLLVLILTGVMQFGLLFWAQITLTQVARDTGRWVASQTWSCNPVDGTAAAQTASQANLVAERSTLFGWSASNQVILSSGPTYTDESPPMSPPVTDCPPLNNQQVWNVSFQLTHTVPVFLPLVATNDCTGGCVRALTSEVQYRVEPAP